MPECSYCLETDGLRMVHDGGGYTSPEYTCSACWNGGDTGPCFDDLPEAPSPPEAHPNSTGEQ